MKGLDIWVPAPHSFTPLPSTFYPRGGRWRVHWNLPHDWLFPALSLVRESLPPDAEMRAGGEGEGGIRVGVDPSIPPEGFAFRVGPQGIRLLTNSRAGAAYGTFALCRWLDRFKDAPAIPCCEVRDGPDLAERGVMLDISRCKVPTLESLLSLVRLLFRLRFNQLQLYMEHTFAYPGHEEVWMGASPLTPDEIRTLDSYCRQSCIELVPNQNSFGHMERWLEKKRYLPLAELPQGGAPLPWGGTRSFPSALCPTLPDSLDFLDGLYASLLPHFTSRRINVGCDEVFDLRGKGRSRTQVEREGETAVFIGFLRKIRRLLDKMGVEPMFWADMPLHHPACAEALRGLGTALVWGYEAGHPFEAQCALLEDSGIPFLVCPGTSSWRSMAGRVSNMRANIAEAAEAGKRHGARGLLLCDWGDAGHWQPLTASLPAYVEASCRAWGSGLGEEELANALQRGCGLPEGVAEDCLVLGDLYRHCGALRGNASELFQLLSQPLDTPLPPGITAEKLEAVRMGASAVRGRQTEASSLPGLPDRERLVRQELSLSAWMVEIACMRGTFRWGGCSREDIRRETAAMKSLFARLWLSRNRSGGLSESLARFDPDSRG